MASEDHKPALIATFAIYGVIIVGTGVWAYIRERNLKSKSGSDELTAHYLAGRSFGPVITACTVFSSLFSGYNIVGAPSEAFYYGFFSLTWLISLVGIVAGYFATAPRLRRASELRQHTSPADFVTDRFQSQYCRYAIVALQIVPTVIFLAGQVISIKLAFNQMFELDEDNPYPSIIVMSIILVFEWAGGLNSVALTDSIQGFVIFISYMIIPFAIVKHFGGWASLSPTNFPRPDFYQTLSEERQWTFWQFTVLNIAFFSLPPLIQRTYAASNLKSLKSAFTVLLFGSWMAQMVGVFMGTMAVKALGPGVFPASPFNAMLEVMMDLGGISKIAAVVTVTASLAAVMSTADSLIIATSQLVINEIILPVVRTNERLSSDHALAWFGRFTSLSTAIIALLIAFYWKNPVFDLIEMQLSMCLMTIPAFVIGLFGRWNCHPWSIGTGAWLSAVYILVFYYQYIRENEDAKPINGGVSGLGLNLFIIFIMETSRMLLFPSEDLGHNTTTSSDGSASPISVSTGEGDDNSSDPSSPGASQQRLHFPNRPEWDVPNLQRFGNEPLTWQYLYESMEGTYEVATNPYWVVFMLVSMSFACPMTPELEPPLGPTGFASMPRVVNGLPWWAFKIILLGLIPTASLAYEIFRMPTEYANKDFGKPKSDNDLNLKESGLDDVGNKNNIAERGDEGKRMETQQQQRDQQHMHRRHPEQEQERRSFGAHVSQTGDVRVLKKNSTMGTESFHFDSDSGSSSQRPGQSYQR